MIRFPTTALALALLPGALLAASWTWHMPTDMYKNLDFEKRATVDSAREAYQRAETASRQNKPVPDQIPLYRAAAAEWQKFAVRFGTDLEVTDDVNAYILFMQALSLQGARDRNNAIKLYTQLLDLYPDETWLTPAAQFMIGQNQLANGENNRAKNTFLALVGDPNMARHPLASRAYYHLGEFFWEVQKYPQAQSNWRLGSSEQFKADAKSDYDEQRRLLGESYAVLGNWKELTAFVFEGIDEKNVKARAAAAVSAEDNFCNWQTRSRWNGWYYDRKFLDKERDKEKAQAAWRKEFAAWHESLKDVFLADGRDWQFTMRKFAYRRDWNREEAKKVIPEASALIKATPEDKVVGRAREFAFALCDVKMYDEARTLLPLIKNPVQNLYLSYDIDFRAGKYDSCVVTLKMLMGNADPAVVKDAKKRLAGLYKDYIRNYDEAIKLYMDINEPPWSLWQLQECYRRSGKKKEAYATLQEIQFFPDQAAAAVWRQAEYRREDGEKDMAIALYRRLLSQPEWKKTWESSQAHQRLEAWGIATGGAVINQVR